MPSSAFFAVLRDVAKLSASAADDLASQSAKLVAGADDIAMLSGKATASTAGVAGDDLAVGATQLSGIAANRELPVLWRITKGSALNKLWQGALLLLVSYFAPVTIVLLLCGGALYLAYEGGEGLLEHFHPSDDALSEPEAALTEDQKVKSAIRLDIVLSFEMGVIALSSVGDAPLSYKIIVLTLVGLIMTIGVYGLIGLIIRLDDMGFALARSGQAWKQRLGLRMVSAAPAILSALEPIGMVAMFAVAGGIMTHLLNWHYPHWAIGLFGDVAFGVTIGLLLVSAHHLGRKLLR